MSLTRVPTSGGFYVESPLVSTEDSEPIVRLAGAGTGNVLAVNAAAPVTSTGGDTPVIGVNKATAAALGVVQPDNSTITVNGAGVISAKGVTAVTGTAPVVSSGGNTPAISVNLATAAAAGVVKPDNITLNVDASGVLTVSPTGVGVSSVAVTAPVTSTGGSIPNIGVNKATAAALGVVRPDNATITVDVNGIMSATVQTTGVTQVNATAPATSTGGQTPTIGVNRATPLNFGVVRPDNTTITVDANGVLSAGAQGVNSVTGTAPVSSTGGLNPNISVARATAVQLGVVRPDNATISVDANGIITAIGAAGGAVTSVTGTAPVVSSGGAAPAISVNKATASAVGVVQPDDTTITVDSNGVISAAGVTTVQGSAPIVSSGGQAPVISISPATTLNLGAVRPDNSTITINGAGVISAVPPAAGVTSVSGTAPIVSSGGSTPAISVNKATASLLGVVQPDNSTIAVNGAGVLSVTAAGSGVTSVTGTAPIVSSGGAAPAISVNKATSGALGVVQPDNSTITVNASGIISAAGSGGPVSIRTMQQVFNASGTFTPSAALLAAGGWVNVFLVGGGGGGATAVAGQPAAGGGGAGGVIKRWITVSGATTVTIGGGGAAGATGANSTGSPGGTTSFGSLSVTGGNGGASGSGTASGGASGGPNPSGGSSVAGAYSGGGGGSSGAGSTPPNVNAGGGNGGPGTDGYAGGGGGGGNSASGYWGGLGSCGGGNGTSATGTNSPATSATANSGSGGGGAGYGTPAGNGGSGIVIVTWNE